MVRIAQFQPFSGASGDMALGALVDAGLPLEDLRRGLEGLGVHGWRLEAKKEMRGPFQATRLRVVVEPHGESGSRTAPEHPHGHGGHHHHPGHRHLADILGIIERSALAPAVKASAAAVFRRLGEAEARVHGTSIEAVHFHEVGAVDSIVDIVGTCLGIHLLGIDEVRSSPIAVGTGFVTVAHGKVPLPAPATLELLKGFPVEGRESDAELTTPTGAALLTTLAGSFGPIPASTITAVGYGAGDDRPGPIPNALRVIIAERTPAPGTDRVVVLETNVDDMTPQMLGHLVDRLLDAGALDAAIAPITMKKSRPGHAVTVLCPAEAETGVLRALFRETTTFGVRRREAERVVLARESRPVETPWGRVEVKIGRLGDEVVTESPEYEDVRRAAAVSGLPFKEVHRRVLDLYRSGGRSGRTD